MPESCAGEQDPTEFFVEQKSERTVWEISFNAGVY